MVLYREVQRFRNVWWIMLLVLGLAAFQWWMFIKQIVLGDPVGNNPAPDWITILFALLFGILMPVFFLWLKLIIEVYPDRIHIVYRPFTVRDIYWNEIADVQARQYGPLREYGGWGVRGFGDNRAYNVKGNQGVQLEFTNGSTLLLGTQDMAKLEQAINAAQATATNTLTVE